MKRNLDPSPSAPSKPRLAFSVATCFGLGYLPFSPGTWGSLAGALLFLGLWYLNILLAFSFSFFLVVLLPVYEVAIFSALGVWAAGRVASHLGSNDPPIVVIDEISGQHFTLILGHGLISPVNWKYLLLGFILFRVFDIWKPFPVRQAEKLPGGWGIMADDWLAAVYAALGLWVARFLGL